MIALKKKQLLANQLTQKINELREDKLRRAVSDFFRKQSNLVLAAFDEYYTDVMLLQGHIDLILAPIHELQKEYYELLLEHNRDTFHRGEAQAERLVEMAMNGQALKAKKKNVQFLHDDKDKYTQHFGTLQFSEDYLESYTFTASERTMSRVDHEINQILTDGYREGWGVRDVRNRIMQRYDQFSSWEANRIARTEMQTAHNMGMMNKYSDMGVEYKEWRAAHDNRVRTSHIYMDGEIAPLDEPFSNGLMYPGDKSGRIEEWINCRCSAVPYLMSPGSNAPIGQTQFRAEDVVSVTEPNYGKLLQNETGGALNWQQYKQILHGKSLEQVLAGVTVAEAKQKKKEPQPKEEKVIKQPKKVETNSEYLFKGEPKKSTLVDRESRKTMDVYEFENIKIAFDRGETALTFEEVKAHLDSLPPKFRETKASIIKIHDFDHPTRGGVFIGIGRELHVYKPQNASKTRILDIFTHELAHSVDFNYGKYTHSVKEVYEKIFKADNKLYTYLRPNGKKRTPKKFPTEYAGKSWLKYKKHKEKILRKDLFVEDFAESTMLYLNPAKHEAFCKEFPNRAKYLESIFGKPNFDKNSPIYKELIKEGLL